MDPSKERRAIKKNALKDGQKQASFERANRHQQKVNHYLLVQKSNLKQGPLGAILLLGIAAGAAPAAWTGAQARRTASRDAH